MNRFAYTARTKEGALYKGTMEAKNAQMVVESLQKKDLTIVSVEEDLGLNLSRLNEINIGGVPLKDKVVFMRQLATMMSASLPLTQALSVLQGQATNPLFKKTLGQIVTDVEGGMSLSSAFRKTTDIFDDITINLIAAGEESGNLERVLRRLALELEKKKKLSDKIRSAFIYPVIIMVVVVAVVILLMVVLVPAMKDIYESSGAELPGPTQMLMSLSTFFINYWWLIIIVLGLIFVGIKLYRDTDNGKRFFAKLALKVPVFGNLQKNIQIAQFTRVLGLLMSSGLSIVEALRLTADSMSNEMFKEAVLTAKIEVEKGVPLALPISRSEYFPLIVSQMIAVGEETGELDKILKKMASYYEDEVDVISSNLSSLMEPIILIVLGGVIAFIALAVYMPMFSLSGAF